MNRSIPFRHRRDASRTWSVIAIAVIAIMFALLTIAAVPNMLAGWVGEQALQSSPTPDAQTQPVQERRHLKFGPGRRFNHPRSALFE
jgi:hypothetical protein